MENAKAHELLTQKPISTGIVLLTGLVCLHAWMRDFTTFQLLLELVVVLIVFLVYRMNPTWWTGLHLFGRSVLAFLLFGLSGLAFVWATTSGSALITWSLFFGLSGLVAVLVPKEYALVVYVAAIFAVVTLHESGLLKSAL